MRVELICIGSELLSGKINTNSAHIGEKLGHIGLIPTFVTTVGDDSSAIQEALKIASERSGIVITTGGLGPTFDDITSAAVAKFLGRRLVLDRETLSAIARFFIERNIDMPVANERQAYIIEGARVLKNTLGTAPGQIIEFSKAEQEVSGDKKGILSTIILLPGPPGEMTAILQKSVLPYLKKYETRISKSFTLHVFGLPESVVDEKIRPVINSAEIIEAGSAEFGILAHQMVTDIKVTVYGADELLIDESLHNLKNKFLEVVGENIYGEDNQTLESVVGELLARNGKTVSIAESCTGGLVSQKFTSISGSTMYFRQAAITYSNESKVVMLGVNRETLEKYGAVSEEVAKEMAEGIRKISLSDYSLSITGIAGPSGGTKEKPVGLVFIGLATEKKTLVSRFQFNGTRADIRECAANHAIELVRKEVNNLHGPSSGKRHYAK